MVVCGEWEGVIWQLFTLFTKPKTCFHCVALILKVCTSCMYHDMFTALVNICCGEIFKLALSVERVLGILKTSKKLGIACPG